MASTIRGAFQNPGSCAGIRSRYLAGALMFVLAMAALAYCTRATASSTEALNLKNFHGRGLGLGYSLKPSKTKPYTPCPPGGKLVVDCGIVIEPDPIKRGSRFVRPISGALLEGSGVEGGWSPADLQSAYNIPTSGGETQTVAIIDAYGDSYIESDLAVYRSEYGLGSCTKANGCFKKVNEKGEEGNYPPDPSGGYEIWGVETALDVEMASAVCPKCKILLVEASGEFPTETAAAVETAVKLGATIISNSYGYPENYSVTCPNNKGCSEFASAYNHPGIPIFASSGDSYFDNEGYWWSYGGALGAGVSSAPNFPASAPGVIAAGGTVLEKDESPRGWAERVWAPSGSGCSVTESKPAWQTDPDCAKRMGNDIAAVAEGISIYSTLYSKGWDTIGGTSVSAPLLAGIEAHASKSVREEGPEAFYRHKLNDVIVGINGWCRHEYACEAAEGWDGPTGWGTPNGPFEESSTFDADTTSVSTRTAEGAKLIGATYPAGTETTYYFEYGPTTAYGFSTKTASAGSGTLWKMVSTTVTGLPPGTYHYRLVAMHGETKTYGGDRTFSTITWSEQDVPRQFEGQNYLQGVSCSAKSDCMAVGWSWKGFSGEPQAWSYRWNGTEWTKQSTPTLLDSSLNGVSCTEPSECIAVGSKSSSFVPLAERWNGTAWTTQSVPGAERKQKLRAPLGVLCLNDELPRGR